MIDEQTLLARSRALDQDALATVHQAYYRPIYRYIMLRVGDTATAEDLTSEVFIRLLTALREPSAPQNTLRGWLYGVASRVVIDHYRKFGRVVETEISDSMMDNTESPETRVIRQMNNEALYAAIQTLTHDQQRVIALRFGAGLRIREVAQIINKSEGAAKQLLLRALSALARQFAAENVYDAG